MPDLRSVRWSGGHRESKRTQAGLDPDRYWVPKLNGLETARRIRELVPSAKIVFLTQESDIDVVQEALGIGARGFIAKGQARTELLAGLKLVLQGELFVSCGLRGTLCGEMSIGC
jgi:DNA-binding NarL/FixJ family response regulator